MQRKVGGAAVAGFVMATVVWLLGYFQPDLMETVPAGYEAMGTAALMTAAGWFIPDAPSKST